MVAQMILSPEGLAANIARERALVGVGALVNLQIVALGELALAVLADELFLWSGAVGADALDRADASHRVEALREPGVLVLALVQVLVLLEQLLLL